MTNALTLPLLPVDYVGYIRVVCFGAVASCLERILHWVCSDEVDGVAEVLELCAGAGDDSRGEACGWLEDEGGNLPERAYAGMEGLEGVDVLLERGGERERCLGVHGQGGRRALVLFPPAMLRSTLALSRSLARQPILRPLSSLSTQKQDKSVPPVLPAAPRPKLDLRPAPIKSKPSPAQKNSPASPLQSTNIKAATEDVKQDFADAEKHGILAPPPPGAGWLKATYHKAKELFVCCCLPLIRS